MASWRKTKATGVCVPRRRRPCIASYGSLAGFRSLQDSRGSVRVEQVERGAHEGAYRACRALEDAWPRDRRSMLRDLLAADARGLAHDLHRARECLSEVLVSEAIALRDRISEAVAVANGPEPFEDVYQAAIYLRYVVDSFWSNDRGRTRLYRGHRSYEWRVQSRLMRNHPLDWEPARRRLEGLVDAVIEARPWLSEREGIAIAQHYGGEPGVEVDTWLLDLTWDPGVALAFASHGGTSEVGVVMALVVTEWERMFGGIAPFEFIRIPGIKRIRNQRALFLDTEWPELLDEYSPHIIRFHQRAGLEFEDPALGISRETLYPKDDEMLDTVSAWALTAGDDPWTLVRPLDTRLRGSPAASRLFDVPPDAYEGLVHLALRPLLDDRESAERALSDLPRRLAVTHAWLRKRVGVEVASLHGLSAASSRAALIKLRDGRDPNVVNLVLDSYLVPDGLLAEVRRISEAVDAAWRQGEATWGNVALGLRSPID
jgi:hypothetical protein